MRRSNVEITYDRHFRNGDIVRHFKGKFYKIDSIAKHTETGELLVVYTQMYEPFETFVRPYEMFLEDVDKVKYPNADQPYRFMKIKFVMEYECNGGLHGLVWGFV